MPVVLMTDPIDPVAVAPLRAIATVATLGEPGFETLDRAMPKADVVIVRRNIPPETLASATRLRALIRSGVGLDFIPLDLASRQGIAVVNTPGVNARSVAEASIGVMLAGWLAGSPLAASGGAVVVTVCECHDAVQKHI